MALVSNVPDGPQNVGDLAELTMQTLDNLKQIMTETGGSTADVIQVLIHLTDDVDAPAINAIYQTFF